MWKQTRMNLENVKNIVGRKMVSMERHNYTATHKIIICQSESRLQKTYKFGLNKFTSELENGLKVKTISV